MMFHPLTWSQIPEGPYLGQQLPGVIPEPFAPELLPLTTPAITFTPDGMECFLQHLTPEFTSILLTTKETAGIWPDPDTASFSLPEDTRPQLTPDGNRVYFLSQRAVPGFTGIHLWYSERAGAGWTESEVMNSPLLEHDIKDISAATSGNLYFSMGGFNTSKIYVSYLLNGNFQEPELLSDSVHILDWAGTPFIAPDESYLLFCTGFDFAPGDLYISYRKPDHTWSKAVALSDTINTADDEALPFVSGDNQVLFFTRNGIVHWVAKPGILTGVTHHPETLTDPQSCRNYPNPFQGSTTIGYSQVQSGYVTLTIYNMLKKEVAVLVNEWKPGGRNEVSFHAGNLPAGVFECVLKTEHSVSTHKIIYVK